MTTWHNGNFHLKFKRLGLVVKLNAVAGGNRLKTVVYDGNQLVI